MVNDEARDDMLWFWLIAVAAVVGLVYGLISVRNEKNRYSGDWVVIPLGGMFFAACVMAIVAVALNGLFLWILGGNNKLTEREVSIVQIGTGSKTEGEFFLGSGYVDSKPVYKFYRDDDGAISQDWIPADFYTKIYQDSTQPRVIIYDNVPKHEWLCVFNSLGTGYVVHVPPNSIDRSVNLNLNGS